MKTLLITALISMGISFCTPSVNASDFLDSINSAWSANDYKSILQLSNAEASKTPANPEALAVLHGYYLFVLGDNQKALQVLDQLITVLQANRPVAAAYVQQHKDRLVAAANGNLGGLPTTQQLSSLHILFPEEFPIKPLLLSLTANN